jgi:hypothetical protein
MKQDKETLTRQRVVVFQQNGSGERKIDGVRRHGADIIELQVVSIDASLPPIIDDSDAYLPRVIDADLVLDFLKHYDLSTDLARRCAEKKIPIVISGKKSLDNWAVTPPT